MNQTSNQMNQISNRHGLLALSPLFLLVLLMVGLSLYCGDFYKVPLVLLFIIVSIVGIATLRTMPLRERIETFSKGAGHQDLMLMVWIFVLAGAFASSAKAMGAVDATVNFTLSILPASMLLPGIFLAACLISLSIGTSVGTIAALVPIVAGLASKTGLDPAMLTASTVGGAFFGDNLSFISDTTVVATKTQGCKMSDKFYTNFLIALPAAIATFVIYIVIGHTSSTFILRHVEIEYIKLLPYFVVLTAAIMGANVLVVLIIGILLTAIIGILTNSYDFMQWAQSTTDGIYSMSETILIAMLAGGLLAVIQKAGGIQWIIQKLTRRTRGTKRAELSIAVLVSLTNCCTANNTVAILSVGTIARDIAQKFNIAPRRTASLLDTFSCFVQGIIPYGAQLLIASGLAGISTTAIMPYLLYPYLLGLSALISILTGWPRTKFSQESTKAEKRSV